MGCCFKPNLMLKCTIESNWSKVLKSYLLQLKWSISGDGWQLTIGVWDLRLWRWPGVVWTLLTPDMVGAILTVTTPSISPNTPSCVAGTKKYFSHFRESAFVTTTLGLINNTTKTCSGILQRDQSFPPKHKIFLQQPTTKIVFVRVDRKSQSVVVS